MILIAVKVWFLIGMYGVSPYVEGHYPTEELCKENITKERPMFCVYSTYHMYEKEIIEMEKRYGVKISKG